MARHSWLEYKIFASLDGEALGTVLHKLLKDRSWGEVQKLVRNRHVQIDGNLSIENGRRLKKGQIIRIHEHPLAAPPSADDVAIYYLDEHLVVVEKPAGMNTQRHPEERNWAPRRRERMPTLEEVLPRLLARRTPGPGGRRPMPRVWAVHRLDRDTSGLMVFALTPAAERKLISTFARHDIERAYRAVALGRVQEMRIRTLMVRDRGDGLRGAVSAHAPAAQPTREAITHIRPIEHLGDEYTLVECRLETGRTHQIRIHLAERGHMICGEKIYCRRLDGSITPDESGAPRQALHAARLGFEHPITGKRMRFESSWPADLARWYQELRG